MELMQYKNLHLQNHYQRQRQCGSKTQLTSAAAAWRQARATDPRNVHGIEAYRCKLCQHYHIGHTRKDDNKHGEARRTPARDRRRQLHLLDLEADLV